MISTKMNKFVLLLSLCFLTQCYTEPFFELTVKVVDENTSPVPEVAVKIVVQDIENGNVIEGSVIHLESTTNSVGESTFSFDNKAFVTVQCCHDGGVDSSPNVMLCKDGVVYLEENINKPFTLMLEIDDANGGDIGSCSYCFED